MKHLCVSQVKHFNRSETPSSAAFSLYASTRPSQGGPQTPEVPPRAFQRYFCNNTKTLFGFFYHDEISTGVQKQQWVKLLAMWQDSKQGTKLFLSESVYFSAPGTHILKSKIQMPLSLNNPDEVIKMLLY